MSVRPFTDEAATDDRGEPVVRFRQIAVLILVVIGLVEAVMIGVGLAVGEPLVVVLILAVMSPVILLFHALTIEVGVDRVRCFFGPGFIARTIPVERIRAVRHVRTSVIDGWGIRKVRGGWLWNVSGFDAVELELDDGRRFLMGTDRPDEVVETIDAVRPPVAGGHAGSTQ